ncbi:MAG: GNAT family N-acetyltransferase [Bacilli bacterium]
MRYKYMKQAVKLLENEWDLGEKESGASRHLCAWIYLMEILEETEQFVYYKENGKLLGFAGYSKDNSTKHLLRKKLYSFIKKQLYKSKEIKDIKALHEYEDNYYYVPDELKNYFDGEVSMLIIDKSLRGKGIGKEMLAKVFELAKKDNMKNLQILTDESCSYYIYESLGCKRIYETVVENKEYGKLENTITEKAYIYEKIL